jgi:FkbM family methyltransferase
MQVRPYRWRLSPSFVAHLWKAATQQHHGALAPLIARLVPEDAIVFDVGAHAGQFAKLFARRAVRGRVYAFEPGSYARSILRSAMWLNRLSNVAIVPAALGAEPGLNMLTVPVKPSGSSAFGLSHLGPAESRWEAVTEELVPQSTVDAAVAALALPRLDLIKADIEGWELQMLCGAGGTLGRLRPRLMLEVSAGHLARAGDRAEDLFEFLAGRGYRGFNMAGGRLAPQPSPSDGDFCFLPEEDALIGAFDCGLAP